MTYQLSQQQSDDLAAFEAAKDYANLYTEITNLTAKPDATGNAVDPMVREWFHAAANAIANIGPEATFIRSYTKA